MIKESQQKSIARIANRHVARCLSGIEEVFKLPEVCAERIRKEMHYTAEDVARFLNEARNLEIEDDTRGNR